MKPWNALLYILLTTAMLAFGATPGVPSESDRFDASVKTLADEICTKGRQVGVIKIAVLGLSGSDSKTKAFGKMLSEELTAKIFATKKYQIIERELLVKILKEQKFELSGPVDPIAIKRLGKLLAIDALLTGTINDTAVGLRINARLISTTSGEVLSVGATTIAKDAFVTGFMRMAVDEIGDDRYRSTENVRLDTLIKQNGFTFECKRFYSVRNKPDDVFVEMVITNLGEDRELTLGDHMSSGYDRGATKITTKSGKEIPIFNIFVGNRIADNRGLGISFRQSGMRHRYPSKQPIIVTFDFYERGCRDEIPERLDLLTSNYANVRSEHLLSFHVPNR